MFFQGSGDCECAYIAAFFVPILWLNRRFHGCQPDTFPLDGLIQGTNCSVCLVPKPLLLMYCILTLIHLFSL